jgi:hypothetical protein
LSLSILIQDRQEFLHAHQEDLVNYIWIHTGNNTRNEPRK